MTIANPNYVSIRVVAEASYAPTPAGPAMQELRVTGEGLEQKKETTRSAELSTSRVAKALLTTAKLADGPLNFEFSYSTFDALLESLLGKTAISIDYSATDISAAAADNSINSAGGTFPATIVEGMWLRISGFTGTAGNNGVAKVVSATTSKIVLAAAAAGGITLVNDAAGESVRIQGKCFRVGAEQNSLLFEKAFTDISKFISFRGMMVDSFTLSIKAGEVVTGSFTTMGQQGIPAGASVSGSVAAKTTSPIMVAGANVGTVKEGGTAIAGDLTAFELSIKANGRYQRAIDSLAPTDQLQGDVEVTGTSEFVLEDFTKYDKFDQDTESSTEIHLDDDDDNKVIITIPALYYTGAAANAGAKNQDMPLVMPWEGIESSTHGNTNIQFDSIPAAS
jgi:hypothetical protein